MERKKYREVENKELSYNEDGEVFLIIDIEKQEYEKLKYLGYDKENQALRYGRYTKGKKYIECHYQQIIEYLYR